MYGNTSFGDDGSRVELSADQRRTLRRDLSNVAARTRELLPNEFVVGSEITDGTGGPRATVAVQPPIGPVVSTDCNPDGTATIDEAARDDLAVELAASAVHQVKEAMSDNPSPTAQ
ncbi:MAG: hypothetical protein ACI8XM_001017 [Haloarculaceae archaeon]|jgi:hypothetical protein